jgi:hypothetical protein
MKTCVTTRSRFAPAVCFGVWFAAVGLLVSPGRSTAADDFNPDANNSVLCLAAQADGRILVGGVFTNLADQSCNYLGRLKLVCGKHAGPFRDSADDPHRRRHVRSPHEPIRI